MTPPEPQTSSMLASPLTTISTLTARDASTG
jgi:hypothetical protein